MPTSKSYAKDGANVVTFATEQKDAATDALAMIDYEHHEIHAGDSFKADINTNDLDDEGDEDALHISFTTANTTKWMHLVVEAVATGAADLSITEAPTGGVGGGDDLTIFNKDRNSSTISGAISTGSSTVNKMTQDASAPTGGTEIHHWKFGTGKNKVGGSARSIEEFILKQNTKYSFRMTSGTADIVAQLTLHWYEHQNIA
jgi:hypothetical protein